MFLDRWENAVNLSRNVVTGFMYQQGVPGMSVAVAVDGKIVWTEGFGFADVENRVPMSEDSVGRAGSVSKMFTLLAAAKLMDEGKLDIDEPVQKYVPEFPEKTWNGQKVKVTTRQLMNHTSGLRHYRTLLELKALIDNGDVIPDSIREAYKLCPKTEKSLPPEFYIRKNFQSAMQGVELFMNEPLKCQPGNGLYSSCGWILLSAIIESVVKRPFCEHMKDIFSSLGLLSTAPETSEDIVMNRIRYYQHDKDRKNLINAPFVDCSWKVGSGGFVTTVKDLLRMSHVYLHSCYTPNQDGFLKPETVRHIWTPYEPAYDRQGTVGLGWVSRQAEHARIVDLTSKPCHHIFHTGKGVGFGSAMYIILDGEDLSVSGNLVTEDNNFTGEIKNKSFSGTTVAMFGNLDKLHLEFIARKIANIFLQSRESCESQL